MLHGGSDIEAVKLSPKIASDNTTLTYYAKWAALATWISVTRLVEVLGDSKSLFLLN